MYYPCCESKIASINIKKHDCFLPVLGSYGSNVQGSITSPVNSLNMKSSSQQKNSADWSSILDSTQNNSKSTQVGINLARLLSLQPIHQENMSMQCIHPETLFLCSKTGVCFSYLCFKTKIVGTRQNCPQSVFCTKIRIISIIYY